MALVRMKKLLEYAEDKGCGIGAFNVANMEMVRGLIKAAEETGRPVIMQIAERRLDYSPLDLMAPMMVQAAKSANVDIAVHLDHGSSSSVIRKALDYGFTSVMFDGSPLPLEENIARTRAIVEMASCYDADVEGELGHVGNNKDSSEGEYTTLDNTTDSKFTSPDEAVYFCRETDITALAIAIGNAHGNYPVSPKLEFNVLEKINEAVDKPLVLHGGTGVTADDFRQAIRSGIRKVNIATASFDSVASFALDYVRRVLAEGENPRANYFQLSEAEVKGTYNNVKRHIEIFSRP